MSDYDNIYQTISSLTHRIMTDVQFKYLRPRIMDIFPQATIQRVEGGGNKASCDIMSSLCQEVSRLSRPSFFRFVQAIEMDHPYVAEDIRVKYKAVTRGITIPHPESTKTVPSPTSAYHKPFVAQVSESKPTTTGYEIDSPMNPEPHAGSGVPSSAQNPPSFQRDFQEPVIVQTPTACVFDPPPPIERQVAQHSLRLSSKYRQKFDANPLTLYNMEELYMGFCLIINNKKFNNPLIGERTGSQRDVANLKSLFEYLGFQVDVEEDKTAAEMLSWLEYQAGQERLHSASSLAVVILTHGKEGNKFLGTDGEEVTKLQLTTIFNSQNCQALVKKPKLFLFQACRGKGEQIVQGTSGTSGFSLEQADSVEPAHNADMCLLYATSDGYVSYRHVVEGSPFVKMFCDKVREQAHRKEFSKIVREVIHDFSISEVGNAKMLPEFTTQLTKNWYLNPPNPLP